MSTPDAASTPTDEQRIEALRAALTGPREVLLRLLGEAWREQWTDPNDPDAAAALALAEVFDAAAEAWPAGGGVWVRTVGDAHPQAVVVGVEAGSVRRLLNAVEGIAVTLVQSLVEEAETP